MVPMGLLANTVHKKACELAILLSHCRSHRHGRSTRKIMASVQ